MGDVQATLPQPKEWMGLPSFTAVGAGSTAVLRVNTKFTNHTFKCDYKASGAFANLATMVADITEIRLVVNGTVQRTHSMQELIDINAFNGTTFKDGEICIHYSEPWRTTEMHQDFFAWGMADVQTFEIEIDIAGTAVSPNLLDARVEISRDSRNMGAIVKYKRHTIPITATGENEWLPLKEDAYFGFHAKSTDIARITVKLNRQNIIDDLSVRHISNDLLDTGWSEQAGYVHLKFDRNARATDGVRTRDASGNPVNEFAVKFDMAAAVPFRVITETYGLRD